MKKYLITAWALAFAVLLHAQGNLRPDVGFGRESGLTQSAAKTAMKHLQEGGKLYEQSKGVNPLALQPLLKANTINPNNARLNFMIGDIYLNIKDAAKALTFLEKAGEIDSPGRPLILAKLAEAYYLNYKFDDAIRCFNESLGAVDPKDRAYAETKKHFTGKVDACEIAKSLVANPAKGVLVDNAGDMINTQTMDYSPVVSADGANLFFSHDGQIYQSIRQGNAWGTAKNLGKPLNESKKDNTASSISTDGTILLLNIGDKNGGDIGYSILRGNKWGTIMPFPEPINTSAHEMSASLSPDGNTLYFTSNRSDARNPNAHHIYYSKREGKGWGPAQAIGSPVASTTGEEVMVFAHPNGKALYFSSNGHTSMGGYDIFRSDFENGKWGTPVNLSHPINTPGDDKYFTMTASGRFAYVASSRKDSRGLIDIYQVTFDQPEAVPEEVPQQLVAEEQKPAAVVEQLKPVTPTPAPAPVAKPKPVVVAEQPAPAPTPTPAPAPAPAPAPVAQPKPAAVEHPQAAPAAEKPVVISGSESSRAVATTFTMVKGLVKDAKSGKAVQQGAVEITDNELGIVVASFDTYLETGRFMISLPAGKSYGVSVRSKGYLVYTENLSTKSNGQYQERDMTIQLNKLDASVAQVTEVAATRKAGKQPTDMVLNTVYFDFGRTNLTDKAIAEIDRVLNILKQNAEMKLIVSGHTDSIGVPIYNQHLSEIRAKVVVDYLVSKGISKKRLTAIGYGSQFPMASNTTRSGRAQNRRAEFDKKEN